MDCGGREMRRSTALVRYRHLTIPNLQCARQIPGWSVFQIDAEQPFGSSARSIRARVRQADDVTAGGPSLANEYGLLFKVAREVQPCTQGLQTLLLARCLTFRKYWRALFNTMVRARQRLANCL